MLSGDLARLNDKDETRPDGRWQMLSRGAKISLVAIIVVFAISLLIRYDASRRKPDLAYALRFLKDVSGFAGVGHGPKTQLGNGHWVQTPI